MADIRWQGIPKGSGSGNEGMFKCFSSMGRNITVGNTGSCFLGVDYGFELQETVEVGRMIDLYLRKYNKRN
ncbi:unnamed protein product [Nezara viridula]|uniref:Uncharacterized protein n=1 Tax=Nezara viridula TaxID=85310 RepID=A0A9P0HMR5_NEZVI|nr:unnamed protein product [Nezara viridula]